MAQKTLYKNAGQQRIVADDEGGEETIWIADDLEGAEVNLSRDELREILPVLERWVRSIQPDIPPDECCCCGHDKRHHIDGIGCVFLPDDVPNYNACICTAFKSERINR